MSHGRYTAGYDEGLRDAAAGHLTDLPQHATSEEKRGYCDGWRDGQQRRRRFDDWRCYRCGTYHLSSTAPRAYVENHAGYRMPVCCE